MIELAYVPRREFERALRMEDRYERAALFADLCRINALYMIMRAGSGHIGSSFSSLDIVSWLYLEEMGATGGGDLGGVYFSSKGHDAPGLYAALTGLGRLDFELIHVLRRLNGLPGHPDIATPGIAANTGSLGQGISKAKGMARARRARGATVPIFVMTGDGELQEGQIWESLQGAANAGLGELTVVVDRNRIQSDTWVADVADLGPLAAKFEAFGWSVATCDGHDPEALESALRLVSADARVPGVVIADTIKGRGVSFMEDGMDDAGFYRFHSGAPTPEVAASAVGQLAARVNDRWRRDREMELGLERVSIGDRVVPGGDRLVTAYGQAILHRARLDPRVIALDADLVLDTGLVDYAKELPERFIECGIAEQDMVSQAGGLALNGFLPIVHSFACFLTTRANEQMYANATEHTKIVYVGSLAGLVPGGPGHSHQMVRDISVMASLPGLVAAEPSTEGEVAPILDSLIDDTSGPAYLRLVTPPVRVPYALPDGYRPTVGRGVTVRQGHSAAMVGAGPVVLTAAYEAAEALAHEGLDLEVVNLPWLNVVDEGWLGELLVRHRRVVAIDNHARAGGQGQMLLAAVATHRSPAKCLHLGVDGVPVCGTNEEVLTAHGLDPHGIASAVRAWILGR